jgi:hypothetical protein
MNYHSSDGLTNKIFDRLMPTDIKSSRVPSNTPLLSLQIKNNA